MTRFPISLDDGARTFPEATRPSDAASVGGYGTVRIPWAAGPNTVADDTPDDRRVGGD